MSGFELVVDTNILIYILNGNKHIAEATRGKQLIISFISEMELRSWPSLSSEGSEIIKKFLSQCQIIPLSDSIKEKAIEIRKKTKLKLPDSIVGATSVQLGSPLLSADRDFKKIADLDLFLIDV